MFAGRIDPIDWTSCKRKENKKERKEKKGKKEKEIETDR
jgi:hypothetical protein